MKALVLFPLAILMVLSMLSLTGLDETTGQLGNVTGATGLTNDPSTVIYYALDGSPKIYANYTIINEPGEIRPYDALGKTYAVWHNASSDQIGGNEWGLYWSLPVIAGKEILYSEVGQTSGENSDFQAVSLDFSSSLGLVGLIVGLMALAAVVGLKILGSGISEMSVSVIFLGTAFLALWGIFSALALGLILEIGLYGPIIYFILTGIYTVGIISMAGGR